MLRLFVMLLTVSLVGSSCTSASDSYDSTSQEQPTPDNDDDDDDDDDPNLEVDPEENPDNDEDQQVEDPNADPDANPDADPDAEVDPDVDPDQVSSVYLEGDGVTHAYTLLNEHGFYEEVPDCGHDVEHISQEWDEELQKYVFALNLHVEEVVDTDRCKEGMEDRQRNEIKTYSQSPATMYGTYGETHTYTWKFRLSEDHAPTTEFTHIHQIKAAGGSDDSQPIITFTTRASSTDRLEVVYMTPIDWDKTYIAKIDLEELRGEWISCTETLTYEEGGDYAIKIERVSDGKVLLDYTNNFDLWREGADLIRPKYGMYRKVYTDTESYEMVDGLKDETIRLADFGIVEL